VTLPSDAVPATFLAFADRDGQWAEWVASVPGRLASALEDWEVEVDGPSTHGYTALVVPVRTADGTPAVLKVGWPFEEPRQEWLALRRWGGRGAVRLLRADPARNVLLLERLHARDLRAVDDLTACEVVASLYADLHVPAPPRLDRLSETIASRTDELAALPRTAPLPRRLVEQAVHLGRALATDPATDGTVVHTDLHDENVLAADREPWLAIDPQPLSGDPHYEPAPMLWNRWHEVVASHDVRGTVRRRFHTLVDVAGLDEDRAREWVVVRELHNALWAVQDVAAGHGDPDDVTIAITVAKAVQD
jgi:streptomycin 6-kinase